MTPARQDREITGGKGTWSVRSLAGTEDTVTGEAVVYAEEGVFVVWAPDGKAEIIMNLGAFESAVPVPEEEDQ